MEDTDFVSQKLTKSETTQQIKNHPSSSARGGGSKNTRKHHPTPPAAGEGGSSNTRKPHPPPPAAGQVAFRLLCHDHSAGGVIGSSGSIIKHLETLTGSKIRFEERTPNCHERVINIVGDAVVERKISVGRSEKYEMVDVSKAQEGLMRVFERVLEVEGNGGNNENEDNEKNSNGLISCRLLAPTGQIGALIGKRGKIVDGIRKRSGAKIRVLKEEQIPACASPEEELIQIMGSVVAVKRAMLAVSSRLQDQTLGERAPGHMSSNKASCILQADSSPEHSPNSPSVLESVVEHHSVVHSLSADVNRTLHLDEDSSLRKVVFKFLCPNSMAGGVIGKGANIVKFLEKETGASIKFASPVSRSKERVAIISSLENPDPLYSPAQIAAVRVFSRCIEVGLDKGVLSSLGNKENVVARILVASDQAGCLLDEGGRIASDISITSGVDIQLMRADLLPNRAGADDNVVQITGNYENVKSALFQVTGRLRQNLFSGAVPKGADWTHGSYSAIPSSSPDGRDAGSSAQLVQLSRLSYIRQLDHLGFVQKSTSSYQPGSQLGQANSINSIPKPVDGAHGSTTFPSGLKQESNVGNKEPKETVEVVVPGEVFGFVYGENCSNLDRLKEISGATIVLQDPSPGESSGKVIISGTPGRIQIAQSLLQAFISF
ncbi:KH domain-containing protein HEN4 isoform X1 [Sesamum indicum]|uniref:KH domain-containing protein HEN4 isoform X1 n=1 Tax=Sesamum indicum TaxID=4182 RepID=A0A6I9ULF8_SESIN|nr:KH domain-containing protein HEN4 isoform X1 [Sesamum indicum]